MRVDTTSQQFFEDKYQRLADPWNFAASAYEQGRYDAIFAALSQREYGLAFEPGCSIGVLTVRLASICTQVQATDISPTAVEQARQRCRHLTNVEITCGALPALVPSGELDLVVLSEIGYYLTEDQLCNLASKLVLRMPSQGVLLAAHWLGVSADHLLSGDRVHELLTQVGGLVHCHSERQAGFRLDRWVRA